MQYAKTLLSVSLIFGAFHAQAETQASVQDNPRIVAPSADMQVAQSNDTSATAQIKNAETPAARSQSRVSSQNPAYEIPLSDYNNGGHFGN